MTPLRKRKGKCQVLTCIQKVDEIRLLPTIML